MNTTKKGNSNIKKFTYAPPGLDKQSNEWASRGSIGAGTSKIIVPDENDTVL